MAIYRQDIYNFAGERIADLAQDLFRQWSGANDLQATSVSNAKTAITQAEIMVAQLKTQRDLVKQSAQTAFPPIPT